MIPRICLILAVLCTPVFGQYIYKGITVPAYSIHELRVGPGEPVLFEPQRPLDLKLLQYDLIDGSYVAAFPTGPPGGILFVDAWRNGKPGEKPQKVRLKVQVEGDTPDPEPDPDPEPIPDLTGLAKQIYDSAKAVGRKDDSRRIAAAYDSVASAIAAGGIKTLMDARKAITEQMLAIGRIHPTWEPTGKLCERALDEFGQTVPGAQKTLRAIAQGLEAASR